MRKAPIITLDKLKEEIEPLVTDGDVFPYEMPTQLEKDLSKVKFDWENYTGPRHTKGYSGMLVGYKVLSNKLPVLFINAGGDWEDPIVLMLYWDGKKIRGYIPKNGNTWHPKYKAAFGSWEDGDNWNPKDELPDENPIKYDEQKLINDILNHFEVI